MKSSELQVNSMEGLSNRKTSEIFARMLGVWGHRFTSSIPAKAVPVAKQDWSESCAGLSDFQIEQGFKKAKLLADWNPNIPEFIRFALNLPSIQQATMRIHKGRIIDPVTRNLAAMIGGYDLKRKSQKEIEKMIIGLYEDAYLDAVEEVTGKTENWKPPIQIAEKKEPEKEVPVTPEVAEKYISDALQGVVEATNIEKKAKSNQSKKLDYNEDELLKELEEHREKVKANTESN